MSNIREVKKFYKLGDKSLELSFVAALNFEISSKYNSVSHAVFLG